MMATTQAQFASALGTHINTASARLRDVPYTGLPRGYEVARVLPLVKWREAAGLPMLFALAAPDGDIFVGDDAVRIAERLCDWMDPVMKGRAVHVQNHFANAFAACRSQVLFAHAEALRMALLIHDSTLPFIVTGDARALPDWRCFAPAFALINAPTTAAIAA